MKKPKLEDFDLTEESEKYLKKFKKSMGSRQGWLLLIIFCVSWGTAILISTSSIDETIAVILSFSLFLSPWFIAGLIDFIAKDKKALILASPSEYRAYNKIKENLSNYHVKLAEYNNNKRRRELETIFRNLVILQNGIYNKKITSENLDTLIKMEEILEQLKDGYYRMTWEEKSNFRSFQNYFNQRKRSYLKTATNSNKKKEIKAKQQPVFTGNNTGKITIMEIDIEDEPTYCAIYRLYDFNEDNQTGNLIIANGYDEIMNKYNLKTSQYSVSIK